MDTRSGNPLPRSIAFAVAAFGLGAALSAGAEPPQCLHCVQDFYYCRDYSGNDYGTCSNNFMSCQMDSGCPVGLPPP
ncbi:hypothetical protein ACI2IY_16730 [Lysobacter enzymogenes]|uniref:hypothetical protein n=1 Tax=Lysobacter enzymogenes TaxID=69 RepID=UPI00384EEBEE